ncbi:STAS domain-containing protein [Nonomuraea helvata]|uniref:Anti-sigma factor antagonist n=2 Tax=Nonomuraea helvata TaxID=37484 RepID=A0ABV5SBV5_9ACTN
MVRYGQATELAIGRRRMPDLSFVTQRLPGVSVISVAGEVDATTAGRLDRYIRRSRRVPGEHVVIDLSEAQFMGSSGLRVLLNTHAYARQHGGSLRLAAPPPKLARIMEITQAHTVLHVHATVEEAVLAALGNPLPESLGPPAEDRGRDAV